MNRRKLLERRTAMVVEMRSLTDAPAGDGGDLSAEQSARFDNLKSEVRGLDSQLERIEAVESLERRAAGVQVAGDGDASFDRELRSFSLVRAIAAQSGMSVDAGREREVSAELERRHGVKANGIMVPLQVFEQRVMTSDLPSGAAGSNLISTDHMGGQFIDRLRSKLVVARSGARVLNGLVGNVDIPALAISATAGWVAENAGLSASDLGFRKVSMTPKHCGCMTEFSRNMLLQSSPDIEALVRDDFAKVLAGAIDKAALKGGGANEPVGILGTSGINTVDLSGGWTWGKVLEFIEKLEVDDAEGTGWATTPSMVKLLRSTPKEVDGSDVAVSADYLMDAPGNLAGYGLISSNNVPSNLGTGTNEHACIFGCWSDLLIGYWSAFDLLVNPYESSAYSKGNVLVRGMLSMDVAVRHAESFCVGQLPIA